MDLKSRAIHSLSDPFEFDHTKTSQGATDAPGMGEGKPGPNDAGGPLHSIMSRKSIIAVSVPHHSTNCKDRRQKQSTARIAGGLISMTSIGGHATISGTKSSIGRQVEQYYCRTPNKLYMIPFSQPQAYLAYSC